MLPSGTKVNSLDGLKLEVIDEVVDDSNSHPSSNLLAEVIEEDNLLEKTS